MFRFISRMQILQLHTHENMNRKARISVIGAGTCDDSVAQTAHELGTRIARAGYDLVCGGLGGVMQAAARGAHEAGGHTIGILPGSSPSDANPHIETPIATGLGQMRNMLVVMNGDAVIAVEGGAGTLSEVALALKSGKTVIAIGKYSELDGVLSARGPQEAVALAARHIEESSD